MKKALKILAIACAGALLTLVLLGMFAHLSFFRHMQAEGFVIEIWPVMQEDLEYEIERRMIEQGGDEEFARWRLPSDYAEDYIRFHIRANLNNRGIMTAIDHAIFLWSTPECPGSRVGEISTSIATEFIAPFSRQEDTFIGSVWFLYIGDIDDLEGFIRSLSFQLGTTSQIGITNTIVFDLRRTTVFYLTDATFNIHEEPF